MMSQNIWLKIPNTTFNIEKNIYIFIYIENVHMVNGISHKPVLTSVLGFLSPVTETLSPVFLMCERDFP